MKDYLKLLRFVRPYKWLFIAATICMGFSAVFDGVSLGMMVPLADRVLTNKKIIIPTKLPNFLVGFVDKINNTPPDILLNYMVVIVLLLFLLKGVFDFFQNYLMSDIGQRVIRDIKSQLYAKIQSLSLNYFTHKRGGELMSRITNDVKVVENAVSYGSTDLIYQSLQVVIFATVIFFIYFKMALIVFVFLPMISFIKSVRPSENFLSVLRKKSPILIPCSMKRLWEPGLLRLLIWKSMRLISLTR